MSTAPQQPVQFVTSVPAYPVQSEVSALAHKHITITYAILGVLVLAMVVACIGGYVGYRGYERALAKAEAAEQKFDQKDQQYQQMFAAFQKQIDADTQERQEATAKQAQLQAQIDARAKAPLPPVVQTGLQADATAQQAGNALGAVFTRPNTPVVPQATPDGKVSVTVKEAQEIASLGLDGQRFQGDYQDEVTLYTLEQSKNQGLTKDLTSCESILSESKDTLKSAQETISAYKKAAVKTKWQKVWSGIKTYGGFLLGVAVGKKL